MNLLVFAFIPALVASFHYKPNRCHKYGVNCINETDFIYCVYRRGNVKDSNILSCPEGYLCQEDSRFPCIQDPNALSTDNGCISVDSSPNRSTEPFISTTLESEIWSGDEGTQITKDDTASNDEDAAEVAIQEKIQRILEMLNGGRRKRKQKEESSEEDE